MICVRETGTKTGGLGQVILLFIKEGGKKLTGRNKRKKNKTKTQEGREKHRQKGGNKIYIY